MTTLPNRLPVQIREALDFLWDHLPYVPWDDVPIAEQRAGRCGRRGHVMAEVHVQRSKSSPIAGAIGSGRRRTC